MIITEPRFYLVSMLIEINAPIIMAKPTIANVPWEQTIIDEYDRWMKRMRNGMPFSDTDLSMKAKDVLTIWSISDILRRHRTRRFRWEQCRLPATCASSVDVVSRKQEKRTDRQCIDFDFVDGCFPIGLRDRVFRVRQHWKYSEHEWISMCGLKWLVEHTLSSTKPIEHDRWCSRPQKSI